MQGQRINPLEEEVMKEINLSLANQVREELGISNEPEKKQLVRVEKKKKPIWLKICLIIIGIIVVVGAAAFIYMNYVLDQANIVKHPDNTLVQEIFEEDENINGYEEIDPDDITWAELNEIARKEADVINVLLVGEEAIGDDYGRGRTDCILIATISKKEKALKLTSLMRDTYVQIPEYSDNKLNAAYHNGGLSLLIDTIQLNFDLEVDGYVLVNFDSFEKVIDELGGVEITLTEKEASYLNRTNYISNPANRTVVEGKQMLNGNQALGYSRIRYVSTADNLRDDFGRNARQRAILNALFEQYKSKSAVELIGMLPNLLSLVTTDLDKSDMVGYIATVLTMGATEIETFSIPVSNGYRDARIRNMDVLVPDLAVNVPALHEFIFGKEEIGYEGDKTELENEITEQTIIQ